MANITTCSMCERAYEEESEEVANQPFRLCPECYHKWRTDVLPPCRMCGHSPETVAPSVYVRCSHRRCRLSHIEMTPQEWAKLHHEEEQKHTQPIKSVECKHCFWWEWDHGAWGYEGNGGLCRYDRAVMRKRGNERCHHFARVP